MTEDNKEKYEGLRWYLPLCFKESLAKCRFEQGTIIYKDKPLGKTWGENKKQVEFLIQIQYPPSSTVTGNGDESVIKHNWYSEVILELFYPNTSEKKIIKTTQGNLFTFLWKDDINLIYDTVTVATPLFKISNKDINQNFITKYIPENSIGFAFIYNPVNEILISKLSSIKRHGSLSYLIKEKTFSIEEACNKIDISGTSGIYPLYKVKLLLFLNSDSINNISKLIEKVVFKGKVRQFAIAQHGVLIKKY